jgi:anti-anti-sigma factor
MSEDFFHTSISDVDLIKPVKNLNLYTIQTLENLIKKLEFENRKKYIFDFESVEFIDSTSLGFLIKTSIKLKAENLRMKFLNLSDNFLHIFHVSGFRNEFLFCSSIDEAIHSSWEKE